jgi:hypothetical protein
MADLGSVEAIIKNGKVQNLETESSSSKTTPTGYDKDSFLKYLLLR